MSKWTPVADHVCARMGVEPTRTGDEYVMPNPFDEGDRDTKRADWRFYLNTRKGVFAEKREGMAGPKSGKMKDLVEELGDDSLRTVWLTCINPSYVKKATAQVVKQDSGLDAIARELEPVGAPTMNWNVGKKEKKRRTKVSPSKLKRWFSSKKLASSSGEEAKLEKLWGLTEGTLEKVGCIVSRDSSSGEPERYELIVPGYCAASSKYVGMKMRPSDGKPYKDGKKSRTMAGSYNGYAGWKEVQGHKTAAMFEGEKDYLLAESMVGDKFDVLGELGGIDAKFEKPWRGGSAVPAALARYNRLILFMDKTKGPFVEHMIRKCRGLSKQLLEVCVVRSDIVFADKDAGYDLFDAVADGRSVKWLEGVLNEAIPLPAPSQVDMLREMERVGRSKDLQNHHHDMAHKMLEILLEGGATFLHDKAADESKMFWEGTTYDLHGGDRLTRRLISGITGRGMNHSSTSAIMQAMEAYAAEHGKVFGSGKWYVRDAKSNVFYTTLYDKEQSMVRMDVSSGEIIRVSGGEEGVFVFGHDWVKPVSFIGDDDLDEDQAQAELDNIFSHFRCLPKWQQVAKAYFSCMFMHDDIHMHPILRLQGESGSGKTLGSELICHLIYDRKKPFGDPSLASLYELASRMPLILQDEFEAKHARQGEGNRSDMLTQAASGIVRTKFGSGGKVIFQETNSWFGNIGIDNIGVTVALNQRMLVIPFIKEYSSGVFNSRKLFRRVSKNRDLIWNLLFRRSMRMMQLVEDGTHDRIKSLLPPGERPRLHDMYAMMSIALSLEENEEVNTVHPIIKAALTSAAQGEVQASDQSSNLPMLLRRLPLEIGAVAMGGASQQNDGYERYPKANYASGVWKCTIVSEVLLGILGSIAGRSRTKFDIHSTGDLDTRLREMAKVLDKQDDQDLVIIQQQRQYHRNTGLATRKDRRGVKRKSWEIQVNVSYLDEESAAEE